MRPAVAELGNGPSAKSERGIVTVLRRCRSPPHDSFPASASSSSRRAIPATSALPRGRCSRWGSPASSLVSPRKFPDPEAVRPRVRRRRRARRRSRRRDARRGDRGRGTCDRALGAARANSPAACCAVRDAATEAIANAAHGDIAFVFGTEMSGLSNAELARCAIVATIPANADYPSLNLAAAVQVVAYELRVAATGGTVWRAPRFAPATADEIERAVRARRADARRDAHSQSGHAEAAASRGCGGSSPAPVSRRRRSTSCAESSRASTS